MYIVDRTAVVDSPRPRRPVLPSLESLRDPAVAASGAARPCVGMLATFFPSPELKTAARNELVAEAKAICASCEVRVACLAGALARGEVDGVWGGELVRDGELQPAYVGPGRPRKQRVAAPVPPAAPGEAA